MDAKNEAEAQEAAAALAQAQQEASIAAQAAAAAEATADATANVSKPVVTKPTTTKPTTTKPVVEPTQNDNIFGGQQEDSGSEADVFDSEESFDNIAEDLWDTGQVDYEEESSSDYVQNDDVIEDSSVQEEVEEGEKQQDVKPTKNNIAVMALAAVAILLVLGKK